MSLSIDNSTLLNYTNSDSVSSTKTNQLESKLSDTNLKNSSDDQLMDVCKSFESYFVEQVYKEMKKTVHSSDDDNDYMQYFGDMMTEQYAKDSTEGQGLGLAKMMYESMKRN